jgi:hypothetical protein
MNRETVLFIFTPCKIDKSSGHDFILFTTMRFWGVRKSATVGGHCDAVTVMLGCVVQPGTTAKVDTLVHS